jgi:regulatory protein
MDGSEQESRIKKRLSSVEAWAKIQHYCAYQERSHREVKEKLYTYGLYKNEVEELLVRCISEGFLNEERFARSFAGGKFRVKKWGRLKIENELKQHGLSKNCIARGLKELNPDDYTKTLRTLLAKKIAASQAPDTYSLKNKVARFAIGKGYESELVWSLLEELIKK